MIFSYNWLQSYFKKHLPPVKQLASHIGLHVFEVEAVEKSKKDYSIVVDILPNRPDCLSHLGMVSEISAFLGINNNIPKIKVKENKKFRAKKFISVKVEDKKACPRYCARVITDIKVGKSPEWLRERLETCGQKSINNIVDAANYVMLEYGQPLHCFDYDKIDGDIVVRFAKKGEKINTLDNNNFKLDKDILIIADKEKPLAIAGIKGGSDAAVTEKTKTIVIESANFNQYLIRNASRKIALRTDASIRFEHGLDLVTTEIAANRLAELIADIADGKIASGIIDTNNVKYKPRTIRLKLEDIDSLLGINIPQAKAVNCLKALGFGVKKVKQGSLDVSVPHNRQDVMISQDLIEEIARIWGYENIEAKYPETILAPSNKYEKFIWPHVLREEMKALGWTESWNYNFIGEQDTKNWAVDENRLLLLDNPLSSEYYAMRPTQLINLCKNIAINQPYATNLKFYEIGKKFVKDKKIFNPIEDEKLMFSGVCTGCDVMTAFLETKKAMEASLEGLGVTDIRYAVCKTDSWYEEHNVACVTANGIKVGVIGPIDEAITKKMKIVQSVAGFELDFDSICKIADSEREYEEISKFPSIVRDISVIVPYDVLIDEVQWQIQEGANAFVRDIELFDIFEKEEEKSLSFHIILQSKNKTLTSQDADNVIKNIIARLESKEWSVRKQ